MNRNWPGPTAVRRRYRAALLSGLALVTVLAAAPGTATAVPQVSVAVSMGDSFISGEAGRWNGNSTDPFGSRNGTDRAAVPDPQGGYTYDPELVYGASYLNGCNRSDTAEIQSTAPTHRPVNISCSGAVTQNIWRSRNGGTSSKGEPPQADQLARIARTNRVGLIVLSIGGNDFDFGGIILRCIAAYLFSSECHQNEQRTLDAKVPAVTADITKAVDEIIGTMSGAGYRRGQYRLIVQSYPSPVPRATENRYSAGGSDRLLIGGCPIGNSDSNWARDRLVPQLTSILRGVADSRGVEFLDLSDAFQSYEVCSTSTRQATAATPPSDAKSEWVRFLTLGITQGQRQESLHPNAYGQRALGSCLSKQQARARGSYRCLSTLGAGIAGMRLVRIEAAAGRPAA